MGLLSTIGAASGRAFGFTRSAIAAATDAFFNRVTLLLPGNGTNGAQNNTFLDSSSNNFTITRNGNTTQGTFTPFSQTGWSLRTNDRSYLSIPASGDFDLISTDFTIEFSFFLNAFNTMASSGNNFFGNGLSTAANGWSMGFGGSGTTVTSIEFRVFNSSVQTANTFSGLSLSINTWYHIALQRNGTGAGNLRLFVNGVQQGSAVNSVTYSTAGSTFTFGSGSYTQNGSYSGNSDYYISNVRLTKSAVYSTSGFTPPTSNLSPLSGTTLLICQSNRLVNNGTNTGAITSATWSTTYAQVVAFSPFAPTAAYSATTNGGSGYFDGTGDYLGIATGGSTLSLNGDFTVELWCYLTTTAGIRSPLANSGPVSGTGTFTLVLGGGLTQLDFYIGSSSAAFGSTNLRLNEWTHIAIVRSGTGANNVKVYKNGVFQIQQSNNSTYLLDTFAIGAYANGTNYWVGNIGQVRIVKGQALCSGDFTPPTAPVTTTSVGWTGANAASSITGTVPFLLNFTNAGITDATGKNVLETVGNAQISTTQSKFGGSSMYFDGTGDWLIVPRSWSIASGENFTIEGWFYLTAAQASFRMILSDNNGASGKYIAITASGLELQFGSTGSTTASITQTFSQNTWYHIAVVRSNNVLSIYIDGVSKTVTNATNSASFLDQGSFLYVGRWSGTSYEFVGYIDDLRITKGYARYASNFTPPTAAFPVQ